MIECMFACPKTVQVMVLEMESMTTHMNMQVCVFLIQSFHSQLPFLIAVWKEGDPHAMHHWNGIRHYKFDPYNCNVQMGIKFIKIVLTVLLFVLCVSCYAPLE